MKFGVVIFPGSNCDQDMLHVLGEVMDKGVRGIFHKENDLSDFDISDCIVLPGGFSYGDYLRSGAIAKFSPIMKSVIEFAEAGGKVLGICNGFQILCESGLLPGALLYNNNEKYICKNVFLKPATKNSMITHQLDLEKALKIPIAHAEGRFFAPQEVLEEMQSNDQILFRYCNEQGEVSSAYNPNGSVDQIAGICNRARNVFGMMPHPERASESIMGNTDGRGLFESLINATHFAAV